MHNAMKDEYTKSDPTWMLDVKRAQGRVPKGAFMPYYMEFFPEDAAQKTTVQQVLSLRKFDANIVAKIIQVPDLIKNS